ncbi:MAG: FMN-binding protein [Planctomycetota bacterium]
MSADETLRAAEAVPPARTGAEIPSWRLILTLTLAGAAAGFLLVFVYEATQPVIQAYKARMIREAVEVVLQDPARFEPLYVVGGQIQAELPAGADPKRTETVYLGYDAEDRPVGFAVVAAGPGYQDIVKLIFGYDPRTKKLLGLKVLESKETPGLGDRIEADPAFRGQFEGVVAPVVGVKKGAGTGGANEVDTISGATISSRAVIRILNESISRVGPMLEAYLAKGAQ